VPRGASRRTASRGTARLACIGEARNKLRLGDDGPPPIRVSVARKLARVLNALCDHYENLAACTRKAPDPP